MSAARLEEMLADAGLAPTAQAELSGLLLPLAATTDLVPEPSAELAALFGESTEGGEPGGLVPGAQAARPWRVRTATAGAVVLAISSVGATGLSAAANSLPSAIQHHVSQFSQHYLPFDFPEPPEEGDQPLGEGRFALVPETSLPHGDDGPSGAAGGVVGVEPPQVLVGADHPSQADPPFLASATDGGDQQEVRSPSHQGHASPSAAPSPSPSASPSGTASPSPSAEETEGAEEAARPPSPTPTATPSSSEKGTSEGLAGTRPGRDEIRSPRNRPGRPDKAPGKDSGKDSDSDNGSGKDSDHDGVPGAGQGDGGSTEPADPATPAPSIVAPELPGLGDLPDLPLMP